MTKKLLNVAAIIAAIYLLIWLLQRAVNGFVDVTVAEYPDSLQPI